MNIKKYGFFILLGAVLMLSFFLLLGNNGSQLPTDGVQNRTDTIYVVSTPDESILQRIYSVPLPEKVTFCGKEVPVNLFYVQEALERDLITNCYMHGTTLQTIKRANRYFPVIEPILKKNNIPDDMKYLCVAESGLRNVVSPAKAEGFWQFLKETGKEYRLEVNDDIDERYHLEKATQAACDYLNKSYSNYQDWELVAAAYNAGNARVNSTIATQKTQNYYDMVFNQETARYVYRIIALKYVMENPIEYGFYIKNNELSPLIPTETLKVDTTITSLVDFAIKYEIPYIVLKELNPWLRSSTLPNKSGKKYEIVIPQKGYMDYHKKLKRSDDHEWFEGY
jgi:hypothetical protein